MKLEILSHTLSESTPLFGGRKGIVVNPEKRIVNGDSCNQSVLQFSNHSSTHVDMPSHFIPGGKSITDVSADFWLFRNPLLIDVPLDGSNLIKFDTSWEKERSSVVDLILLRTGMGKWRGTESYWKTAPGLAANMAGKLIECFPSLRALGVDLLSITSFANREEGRLAHREFLGRNIVLIEDMRLDTIVSVPKNVLVSPLLLDGLDGAPVTVWGFE